MTTEERGQSSETRAERPPDEVDAVFDVLSDPYRRRALYYLRERERTSVDELTTVLTGWSNADDSTPTVADPARRREVAIALVHRHLPKLADSGFVTYDSASRTVRLESVPESLAAYLDLSLEVERGNRESRRTTGRPTTDESR